MGREPLNRSDLTSIVSSVRWNIDVVSVGAGVYHTDRREGFAGSAILNVIPGPSLHSRGRARVASSAATRPAPVAPYYITPGGRSGVTRHEAIRDRTRPRPLDDAAADKVTATGL